MSSEQAVVEGRASLAARLRSPHVALMVGVVALLFLAPTIFGQGQVPLISGILLVVIFTYAWHPVGGILGEISMAHVAFWGAGAYATVLGGKAGFPFLLSLVLGCVVAVLMATVMLELMHLAKLRGLNVMIFTLVFLFFTVAVVQALSALGGTTGLIAVAIPLSVDEVYYSSALFIALLLFLNFWLLSTRRGLVWLAIRDDPDRVPSLGWSVLAQRRSAYWLTSALCAVGGALAAATLGFVNPQVSLGLGLILVPLLAVYVGGPGTLWGPLLGVLLLEMLAAVAIAYSRSAETAQYVRLGQFVAALLIVGLALRLRGHRPVSAASASPAPRDRRRRLQHLVAQVGSRVDIASRSTSVPVGGGALRVDALHKSFAGLHVLSGVSFIVRPGEVVGMVGPNGAGKSTLCNLIAGSMSPDRGAVFLGDDRVDSLPEHRRASAGLGRTFQTPQSFQSLTLTENVCIAGAGTGSRDARQHLAALGVQNPDVLAASASLFERRMVEVARLQVMSPRWVLLDEPFAGLSSDEHDVLLEHIQALAREGAAVLLIEHLIPVVAPICDRIVVLSGGRLIADGPPRDVLRNSAVVEAYLGAPLALEL